MTLLRQLLLLPLLAPLLAVLLVGAVNPKPQLRLRLLTWTSPALPLGVWLMLAGSGGAALSAAATSLALAQGMGAAAAPDAGRRQVRRPAGPAWKPWREESSRSDEPANGTGRDTADWPGAGPSRSPGEPAPTVEARYRVLRRPARAAATAPTRGNAAAASPAPASSSGSAAGGVADDWGEALSSDW